MYVINHDKARNAATITYGTVQQGPRHNRSNVSDRDGASAMVALNTEHLCRVCNVLVDGGYSGVNFQLDVASNLNATVQVAKRNELHRFEAMPQRWVVERSFS